MSRRCTAAARSGLYCGSLCSGKIFHRLQPKWPAQLASRLAPCRRGFCLLHPGLAGRQVKADSGGVQALLAQGDASKAVPDLQKAIQNSSADDAAVMQEVLDRARAQVPVVCKFSVAHRSQVECAGPTLADGSS